jgi:hypothetical protein
MSYEAHFPVTGFMNKQNLCYWAQVYRRELHKQPPHSPKVIVWCGVGTVGTVGPFFFENDNGATITVTAAKLLASTVESTWY